MNTARVMNHQIRSPLQEAMRLRPTGAGPAKKKVVATLVLTSLVDAFSIILIYLLFQNTSNGTTMEIKEIEKLPVAVRATALTEGLLVKITGDKFIVGEETVDEAQLASHLRAKRGTETASEPSLVVQADDKADFSKLSTIVRAASVGGYHHFKFAVRQEEGAQ